MQLLPRRLSSLRNVVLPTESPSGTGGVRRDVLIEGDTVVAVLPAGTAPPPPSGRTDADADADDSSLDLDGFLLLTAPAEPHAHLDKAFSWDLIEPPMGDLERAIVSWQAYASTMTVAGIADRARQACLALLRNGTTAIRTHIDILRGDLPLRGVQALVEVRGEFSGLLDLELVALTSHDTSDATIEAALGLGVDLVGGAPHLAPDPELFIDRLLAIAARHGVGVDLHTDESLTGPVTLPYYARAVRNRAPGTSLSAGHCVRLGTLEAGPIADILDDVLASDIGIISLPITNLYLQGWQHPTSTPRGLTALRELLDRGVRLGAGADNVRDPFNPVGRSDALETASLLVTAGHLTLTEAYSLVSDGARAVLRLPPAGAVVGAQADFLAVRGTNLADVIASAPADRYVIHAGQLVSHSAVTHHTATHSHHQPEGAR